MLGVSKSDPTTVGFNDIFFAAANGMTGQTPDNFDDSQKKPSVWPILTFLSFIFVTPYLIMKLIGQVSTAAIEECKRFFLPILGIPQNLCLMYIYIDVNSKKSSHMGTTKHRASNVQLQGVQST